jgi:TPR repeat protein
MEILIGTAQDLLKKAELGDAEAQNKLGRIYENGFSYEQINLGTKYFLGQGIPKDYKKAFEWFLKAAARDFYSVKNALREITNDEDNKNAEVQYYLGQLYESKDKEARESVEWYIKATNQGHDDAQKRLNEMADMENKHAQRYVWFKKAEVGDEIARYNLCKMYRTNSFFLNDYNLDYNKC